jgi:hypothetical protein
MNGRSLFRVLGAQFVFMFGSVFALFMFTFGAAVAAQQPIDGPTYVKGDNLVRPANYREWVFIGSGLGLTYEQGASGNTFTNVFVNPAAYRGFMSTGRWPDKSVFILEFRASGTEAPPNTTGRFQTRLIGLEAEVKDARFPDGWAFYNFRLKAEATPEGNATPEGKAAPEGKATPEGNATGPGGSRAVIADTVAPLAGKDVASCVECHTKSTAVERTFVQFYPTLLEVARAKGTVKPGF